MSTSTRTTGHTGRRQSVCQDCGTKVVSAGGKKRCGECEYAAKLAQNRASRRRKALEARITCS